MIFASLENSPNKKWWILITMALSLGMTFIDQTAVAIALPKIQQEFSLSFILLQWIVNGYLLALSVFLIPGGRLGDLFRRDSVFIVGLLIFVLTSIACALAPNTLWLMTSRALQGLGAAIMIPNSAVMIINTFPQSERGKAMGYYLGSSLFFLPLSIILGGVFTQLFSWRWIFWINVPLSIFCIVTTYYLMKSFPTQRVKQKFDWSGLIALVIVISTLVIALMESSNRGWNSFLIIFLLCSSVFFLFLFYFVERSAVNPTVDLSIFRNKILVSTIIILFSLSILTPLFIFDAFFYQVILGFSPIMTSVLFFPTILCLIIASPIAGKVLDLYGYRIPVIAGLILIIAGLFANATLVPLQNYWYLLPGIICINIGSPFVISPINTAALSSVEENKRGMVSGILSAIRRISSSITLALLTSIVVFAYRYFSAQLHMNDQLKYADTSLNSLENILSKRSANYIELSQLFNSFKAAYSSAYSVGIYACAMLTLITLIIILMLFLTLKDK